MPHKRVLFIDDDTDMHDIMAVLLEGEDIQLHTAVKTCPVAVIARFKPDLILLDEWLPGKSGSVFCSELKSNKATRNIPIILISAVYGLEGIAIGCQANAFICKPFDIGHLKQVVNSFLAAKAPVFKDRVVA